MNPLEQLKRKRADSTGGPEQKKQKVSLEAKSETQRTLHDMLSNEKIRSNIEKHLAKTSLWAKVKLSTIDKSINSQMRHDLYNSHAQTLPYTTKAQPSEKTNKEEADEMNEHVRKAVNVAYQMLIGYLKGEELNPKQYGIRDGYWDNFLQTLHPDSKMMPNAAAGYVVEEIATYVLNTWDKNKLHKDNFNFQDVDLMEGSRPDITSKTKGNENVLIDITSTGGMGHITDKKGGWLSYPHVAEVLYPSIDFKNLDLTEVKMTEDEKNAIRQKALQKLIKQLIDDETGEYANFLKARQAYYENANKGIKGIIKNSSVRQIGYFEEDHKNIKLTKEGKKLTFEVESYTSQKDSLSYDPYENAPKSPPIYSIVHDSEMEEEEKMEEDLIKKVNKVKYLSRPQHMDEVTKKHNKK